MSLEMGLLTLAWIGIVVLALSLSALLGRVHLLEHRLGDRVVSTGPGLREGEFVTEDVLALSNGKPHVALFMSKTCLACVNLAPHIVSLAATNAQHVRTTIFYRDEGSLQGQNGEARVLTNQAELFDKLGIAITPFVVTISANNRVLKASPVGNKDMLADTYNDLSRATKYQGETS